MNTENHAWGKRFMTSSVHKSFHGSVHWTSLEPEIN